MKKIIQKIRNLINDFPLFSRYPVSKQFIKFCLVGLTNVAVELIVYIILTRTCKLFYIVAALLAYLVAVSWSFLINRRWTFRHNGRDIHRQYAKFFIANTVSETINIFLLYLFVNQGGMHDILAKFLASFIVAFFNFALNRWWTFKVSDDRK